MAGYSDKTLLDKLGYRINETLFLHAPPELFKDLSVTRPQRVTEPLKSIHGFYTQQAALKADITLFTQQLDKAGMLWISWPKKSSGVITDLDENKLRELLLPTGLVDVKVCAVTDIWSGLKFVWRRDKR
jgi:hypothetical protein